MKWKRPADGERRVRVRRAWWPMLLSDETTWVWLSKVRITDEYVHRRCPHCQHFVWVRVSVEAA